MNNFQRNIYRTVSEENNLVLSPFEVTATWDEILDTLDAIGFKSFLEGRGLTSVIIENFDLTDSVLTCDLYASGTLLSLEFTGVTSYISCGNIDGITSLGLNNNNITNFNTASIFPPTLTFINMADNGMTNFNPSIALPSGLLTLDLGDNSICTFNPTIPLPTSINYLRIGDVGTNPCATNTEAWASSLTVIPSRGTFEFSAGYNVSDSATLRGILVDRGWTIVPVL